MSQVVYLPTPLGLPESSEIHSILASCVADLKDGRKGRHWEFVVNGVCCSLQVIPTSEQLSLILDDLEALGLDAASAPEAVVIVCAARDDEARNQLDDVVRRIVSRHPDARVSDPGWS